MVVVFFSSRRRHTRCALVTGVQTCARPICNGSSALRPGRDHDWGYRERLTADLPASEQAIDSLLPALPRVIGGHSLGGQLACCRLALDPHAASVLWLVASGAPYWRAFPPRTRWWLPLRSEEHTSELQSLMRISYAVFCLKKKNKHITNNIT